VRGSIEQLLVHAAREAARELGADPAGVSDAFLRRTRNPLGADLTSHVALRHARGWGCSPIVLAQRIVAIARELQAGWAPETMRSVERIEASGVGYVNVVLVRRDLDARVEALQGWLEGERSWAARGGHENPRTLVSWECGVSTDASLEFLQRASFGHALACMLRASGTAVITECFVRSGDPDVDAGAALAPDTAQLERAREIHRRLGFECSTYYGEASLRENATASRELADAERALAAVHGSVRDASRTAYQHQTLRRGYQRVISIDACAARERMRARRRALGLLGHDPGAVESIQLPPLSASIIPASIPSASIQSSSIQPRPPVAPSERASHLDYGISAEDNETGNAGTIMELERLSTDPAALRFALLVCSSESGEEAGSEKIAAARDPGVHSCPPARSERMADVLALWPVLLRRVLLRRVETARRRGSTDPREILAELRRWAKHKERGGAERRRVEQICELAEQVEAALASKRPDRLARAVYLQAVTSVDVLAGVSEEGEGSTDREGSLAESGPASLWGRILCESLVMLGCLPPKEVRSGAKAQERPPTAVEVAS